MHQNQFQNVYNDFQTKLDNFKKDQDQRNETLKNAIDMLQRNRNRPLPVFSSTPSQKHLLPSKFIPSLNLSNTYITQQQQNDETFYTQFLRSIAGIAGQYVLPFGIPTTV